MDESRRYDIEELTDLYRRAPNQAKRDAIAEILRKIYRESSEIRKLREELLIAIRRDDRRHVRRVQERLRIADMNRFGGKETIRV